MKMKGAEVQGKTSDDLARAGEGETVEISARPCPFSGRRVQTVVDRFGNGKSDPHCRGCGKRVPA